MAGRRDYHHAQLALLFGQVQLMEITAGHAPRRPDHVHLRMDRLPGMPLTLVGDAESNVVQLNMSFGPIAMRLNQLKVTGLGRRC